MLILPIHEHGRSSISLKKAFIPVLKDLKDTVGKEVYHTDKDKKPKNVPMPSCISSPGIWGCAQCRWFEYD
jgi:hypothetical protein